VELIKEEDLRETDWTSFTWKNSSQMGLLTVNTVVVIHTHTHPLNDSFSGTTRMSRYQKGKTNLDFTEARDNEWQWHQLGHMEVGTSLQRDNHASTPPLSYGNTFLKLLN